MKLQKVAHCRHRRKQMTVKAAGEFEETAEKYQEELSSTVLVRRLSLALIRCDEVICQSNMLSKNKRDEKRQNAERQRDELKRNTGPSPSLLASCHWP